MAPPMVVASLPEKVEVFTEDSADFPHKWRRRLVVLLFPVKTLPVMLTGVPLRKC